MTEKKSKNKILVTHAKTDNDEYVFRRSRVSEDIKKSIGDFRPDKEEKQKRKYKSSKVVFTGRYGARVGIGDSLSKEGKRLSDAELKELSLIDPYISAIINTRVSQISSLSQRAGNKFDKGLKVLDLVRIDRGDFDSDEDYENELKIREAQKEAILKWILNCGTDNKDVLREIYKGADPTFKYCSLKDYFQAQTRNLLTFGRCGRQNLRSDKNVIVAFRPTPIETIKVVKAYRPVSVPHGTDTSFQSVDDANQYNKQPEFDRPPAYVQEIDGANVNFFTEEDMRIMNYQTQAFVDLNGYPLSPIEFALFLVYINQHCLSYLRNQFVKGMLTKSMLILTSTDPSVQLSEEDLESFKMEMQNFASRTDNSAVMPVIGGPITGNFIRMNDTMKDLEWINLSNAIIRALCSAYQISPLEAGFGQLGDSAGMGQGSRDYELVQGEERGLRLITDIMLDDLNDILYDNFPEAKERFRIEIYGIGSETRESAINRQLQEQQTTGTMNDLLSDSDKNRQLTYGGDVPLNPLFHSNVVRYMKYGKFLETYFGEEDASKKPEYDFIIDMGLNQAYQSIKMQTQEMSAQQQALALEQQKMQLEAASQQMSQPQEPEQQAPQQTEQVEKSEEPATLEQVWLERNQRLLKSWNQAQEALFNEFDNLENQ